MNSNVYSSYDTSSLQRRFSQKLASPKRDPNRPNIQVDMNERKIVKDTPSLPAGFLTTGRVRKSHSMKHYAIEGSMPRLGHILRELLDTENDYVISLERTVEFYLGALLREKVLNIKLLAERIFGNVEDILHFHKNVFLVRLEDAQNSAGEVSALMLEYHKEFTELYIKYCLMTCNASQHLKEKPLKNLFKAVRQQENDKRSVSDYVIKPIQRITKYELMLDQIIQTYRKADIPCRNIERAYSVIKEVPTLADNAMKLNSILNYSGTFKVPHLRQLKLHNIFTVSDRDKRFSHKKYYVFLMLDRIIFTKLCNDCAETEMLCTFKRELTFEEDSISIKLETVPDKDAKIFVLQTCKKEIYMQAEKMEIKEKWLTNIKGLIKYHYTETVYPLQSFPHQEKKTIPHSEPSYQPIETFPTAVHTDTLEIDDSSSGGDMDSDVNDDRLFIVIDDFNPDETMNGFIALRKGQIYEVQLRELAYWHVILVGHVYTRNDSLTGLQGLAYPQFFTDYNSESFTSSESAISPESNLSDEQTESLLNLSSEFVHKMIPTVEGIELQIGPDQLYSPVMVKRAANKKYASSSLLRHLRANRSERSTTETEEDSTSGFDSARSSISRTDSEDREMFYSVTSDSESDQNSKLDYSNAEVDSILSNVFLNSDRFTEINTQQTEPKVSISTPVAVTPTLSSQNSNKEFSFLEQNSSLNDQILLKYGSREELNADFPPDGHEEKPLTIDIKTHETTSLMPQNKAESIPANLNTLEQDTEPIHKLIDSDSRQSTPVALDNVINRTYRPLKRSTSDQSRKVFNVPNVVRKNVKSEIVKDTENIVTPEDNDILVDGDDEQPTGRKRSIHKIIERFNSCSNEIGKSMANSKRLLSSKRKSLSSMEELEFVSPIAMRLNFFAEEYVSNEEKYKTLTPPKDQRKHDLLKRTLSIDTEKSLQIDASDIIISPERPSSTDTINSSINSDFILRTQKDEPTYLAPPTLVGDEKEKVIVTTGANKTRLISPEPNPTYKMPIKIVTKKVSSIPLPPPKKPKPKISLKRVTANSLMGNFEMSNFNQLFDESPLEKRRKSVPPPIQPKNKLLIGEYKIPAINTPLKDVKVSNGRFADISFELDQEIENVQVDWYKDSCPVTLRRYYANVNGKVCSLKIWDFGELDQGTFEAVVKSRAGQASTKCEVQLANK